MGSFDFNAPDGTAAIFGPINESVVVHMSKFKKVNHVSTVINLDEEYLKKKAGQTVRWEM